MEKKIILIAAGNVEIPAYLTITSKGYAVRCEKTDSSGNAFWIAEKNGNVFKASSPIELLGVIGVFENRGIEWHASDKQIEKFQEKYKGQIRNEMKYSIIESSIDYNDPEEGFRYDFNRNMLILQFVDWRNKKIIHKFFTVYKFLYRISNGWQTLPEASMLEILESAEIESIRNDLNSSEKEEMHHFILSTNEDEWCEIVAEKYELEIK